MNISQVFIPKRKNSLRGDYSPWTCSKMRAVRSYRLISTVQLDAINERLSILAAVVYEITPKVFYNIENSSPFGDKDEGQFTLPKRLNHIMNYLSPAWITLRNWKKKKKLKIKTQLEISPVNLSGLPNDLRDANPQDKQNAQIVTQPVCTL